VNAEGLQEAAARERERRTALHHRLGVCTAAGCLALGSDRVKAALARGVEASGLGGQAEVFGTGCLGLCHAGPLVQVESRQAAREIPFDEARERIRDRLAREKRAAAERAFVADVMARARVNHEAALVRSRS